MTISSKTLNFYKNTNFFEKLQTLANWWHMKKWHHLLRHNKVHCYTTKFLYCNICNEEKLERGTKWLLSPNNFYFLNRSQGVTAFLVKIHVVTFKHSTVEKLSCYKLLIRDLLSLWYYWKYRKKIVEKIRTTTALISRHIMIFFSMLLYQMIWQTFWTSF